MIEISGKKCGISKSRVNGNENQNGDIIKNNKTTSSFVLDVVENKCYYNCFQLYNGTPYCVIGLHNVCDTSALRRKHVLIRVFRNKCVALNSGAMDSDSIDAFLNEFLWYIQTKDFSLIQIFDKELTSYLIKRSCIPSTLDYEIDLSELVCK